MDPRLYTYEYRRPRLSNPTYISNNVNSSLTYYLNGPATYALHPQQQNERAGNQHEPIGAPRNEMTPNSQPMQKNRSSYLQNAQKRDRYDEAASNRQPQPYDRQSSMPKIGQDSANRVKANSHLSNYGTNVLNNESFKSSLYNDQEVYKKQQKKFNIITLKPNPYEQTIKQYPKLTLEDKDVYFYKKLRQQQEFQDHHSKLRQMQKAYEQAHMQHYEQPQQPNQYEKGAGKPTFSSQPYPTELRGQPNAKALTNLDELSHI